MRVKTLSLATTVVIVLALVLLNAAQRPAPVPPPAPPLPMPPILKAYPPVTAADLLKPADDEWLMIRRTYDGWGYSPLDQITAANVARLQPAWVFATGAVNGHEAPPLVRGGVMFVSTPGNQVIAVDARTGRLLWRYRRPLPEDAVVMHPTTRGVALYGDKVYLPANEGVLVALDARTGQGSVDGRGRRKPARLLHDAGAAGGGRPRDDRRLGRRVRHSRIRGGLRRRNRQGPRGRPTRCPRRASPAARPGPRVTSGRPAARRYG